MSCKKIDVPIKLVNPLSEVPRYAHAGDAGLDLCSTEDCTLRAGETKMVGLGVSLQIPSGYMGLVCPRSGLGSKGLTLSNAVGIIDSNYRGEIKAPLHNNNPVMHYEVISEHPDGSVTTRLFKNDDVIEVKRGDRICQLILLEVPEVNLVQVDNLDDGGTRGKSGFGSSGVSDVSGGDRL